jgi:serine/threonine protein kinase
MTRLAGRYELERPLAEGGMAEVWVGTAHGEAGFTRKVAIKRLFVGDADSASFARRFLDEARITSRLHHANIVSILDFGVEEGCPFQVLELIDGFDVGRLCAWGREQGAPLPVGLALHVCATIAHALDFAHKAVDDEGKPWRLVHRDVSPQNILLSRGGDVKLTDFGIAFAEGRTEKTVGGVARGKPAYMAPEQALRGALDARTDVFALGCVLHALVTGTSPLRDENALVDLLAGIDLTYEPTLPERVRVVVERATRRNKAERYESAEAFALAAGALVPQLFDGEPRTALRDWVNRVAPKDAPSVTVKATPAARPRRRWPWALVPVGVLSAVAVTLWPSPSAPPVAPEPVHVAPSPAPPPVKTEETPAPVVAPTPVVVHKPAPPTRAPAPKALGVLAIGGEALLRGEVFIDGASRGFAPRRFEVPVGPHTVEVVTPDGQHHGPRTVELTSQHTASTPLPWLEAVETVP